MDWMAIHVSRNLHQDSIRNIFYARLSFFDTTPTGRMLGIFGKDIDSKQCQKIGLFVRLTCFLFTAIDNQLASVSKSFLEIDAG